MCLDTLWRDVLFACGFEKVHATGERLRGFTRQRGLAAFASADTAELVVQVDDAIERPVGGRSLVRDLRSCRQAQIGDECLKVARDLGEIFRVALQLFQWFVVQMPQRLS